MVKCTKCGAENRDDASYCSQCGEPLHGGMPKRRQPSDEDFCFGERRGPFFTYGFWPLLIGIIIVLWGIGMIFNFSIWPYIVIAIGLYIIFRAFYRRRRYYT
jgi:uncharacterized membrane protein YvbJ